MTHPARDLFLQQAADAEEQMHARDLTLNELEGNVRLDRDDILPAREVAAALLGLDARRRETYMRWAGEYASYIMDAATRESLSKLVKWTRLLSHEFGDGVVRVDQALDFASSRGWLPASSPACATAQEAQQVHKEDKRRTILTTEIELAISDCESADQDANAVFNALKNLADEQVGCLMRVEGGAVVYEGHDGSKQTLTLKNLRDRLARRRGNAR